MISEADWAKLTNRASFKVARDEALSRTGAYEGDIYYQTARTSHGNIVLLLFLIRKGHNLHVVEFQRPKGRDKSLELLHHVMYTAEAYTDYRIDFETEDLLVEELSAEAVESNLGTKHPNYDSMADD